MVCCLPIRGLGLVLLTATVCAGAQTVEVPRPAAGEPTVQTRSFDLTHLKDRPYTNDLPKPSYPSTERVQREFVVEYLYDYAFSAYTPVVKMPVLPAAQFQRDTPEHALIALFSAMRSGDFENWMKGWDEKERTQLEKGAKEQKQDAVFWRKLWSGAFSSAKDVELVDRIETASKYVILDVRLPGTNLLRVPNAFKLVQGQWLATNELSTNPILYQFRPELAGVVNMVPPVDVSLLDKENTAETETQQQFLYQHTLRDRVVQAGKQ